MDPTECPEVWTGMVGFVVDLDGRARDARKVWTTTIPTCCAKNRVLRESVHDGYTHVNLQLEPAQFEPHFEPPSP